MLALPGMAFAQEAVLTGTITDPTGAVLPGVTVQAVHEASGNNYEAVTDARGVYRIPVRVGSCKITAELTGFGNVDANRRRAPRRPDDHAEPPDGPVDAAGDRHGHRRGAAHRNAVLVKSAATSIRGRCRICRRPAATGCRWRCSRPATAPTRRAPLPVQDRGDVREFQLNVDGLQVTANLGTGNQARYSNDAIAEFQFISNRFDATQGRSSGVQVNAITKSGTNSTSGTFVGNFRNSQLERRRIPCCNRVLPHKNQQIQRHDRRADHPQQAALLRQLRVRASAAHLDLEHAVPGVQRHAERRAQRQAVGRPSRPGARRRRCG